MAPARKSVYSLITIIGLGYFVLFATVQLAADWLGGTIPFFDFYHVPFIILFIISILLVWTRPRIGYLVSMIVGLFAVAIFTPLHFCERAFQPGRPWSLRLRDDGLPIDTGRSILFSMGLLVVWKPELSSSFRFSLLRRSVAVLVLGFIVGGVTVGVLAAGTENQLLASAGTSADITIPKGAGTPGNIGYILANFTTTVGKTVIWTNKDTTTHTVTSTTGLFDSGILNPGQTYSHIFTQVGVYSYYCTLHSWMKGNVTVKP